MTSSSNTASPLAAEAISRPGPTPHAIGQALSRVDGPAKVTGRATFAADTRDAVPDLVHAVLVQSTISHGRILSIDTSPAEALSGVLAVITHLNAPRLGAMPKAYPAGPAAQSHVSLQDARIIQRGQSVAVVVADTFERATDAAARVRIEYEEAPFVGSLRDGLSEAFAPVLAKPLDQSRGDPDAALAAAEVRVEAEYETPIEHHNPMEPHATVAIWEAPDRLTVHEPTQWLQSPQRVLAALFGLEPDNVRVLSPFVGGAFGCKAMTWAHVPIAAMAARTVGRPVKLVLTRPQMFTSVGYRPATIQRVALGATRDGILTALVGKGINQTSMLDDFVEHLETMPSMLYAIPNLRYGHKLVRTHAVSPTVMRAPGEASGAFGLECAMDELAVKLGIDPIELRLKNYADIDLSVGLPWSSKSLKGCYRVGAEAFGWAARNPKPGSMRDGRHLIGWGMASATYPVVMSPAAARVRLLPDGTAVAEIGTHDLGTGTYTIMVQIAAEALGLSPERVRAVLGDSSLPRTPPSGGSRTAGTVGQAVFAAAHAVRDEAIALAVQDPGSPLHGLAANSIEAAGGRLFAADEPARGEMLVDLLSRRAAGGLSAYRETLPPGAKLGMRDTVFSGGEAATRSSGSHSMFSFGAQFVEVRVDAELKTIRVSRMTGAFAAGRILNPKTARSQLLGGMVMGIGQALMERTIVHPQRGRVINANFADYWIPVNADIPEIDVHFIEENDTIINALGAKGVGELGIVGVAPAIANAVFHATGRRVRSLPLTLDTLLTA